jgi:hypothetical protein
MSIFLSNHEAVIASALDASFAALDVHASGDIDTPLRIAEEAPRSSFPISPTTPSVTAARC